MLGSDKLPTINNDIINPMIEKLLAGEDTEKLMNEADEAIDMILSEE